MGEVIEIVEPQYVKNIHFVNISRDDGSYYGTCPFCNEEIQWYGGELDNDRKYTKCICCDKPILWKKERRHYYF